MVLLTLCFSFLLPEPFIFKQQILQLREVVQPLFLRMLALETQRVSGSVQEALAQAYPTLLLCDYLLRSFKTRLHLRKVGA